MRPNLKTAVVASAIILAMALAPTLVSKRQEAIGPGTAGPGGMVDAIIGMPLQTFVRHAEPRPMPDLNFKDGDGKARTLSEFRGTTVLLNVWATWCPPCRHEMPTLDQLQAMLGGPEFQVVALSIDRAGPGTVARFFREVGLRRLVPYVDESGRAAAELGLYGLPGTLLIDAHGREIGRMLGPAAWASDKMIALLRASIGGLPGVQSPDANGDHALAGPR